MILSVSRRTDIPNYYSDWFLNRIKAGFLCVKNPVNPHQVSRIDLSPELVDCIVFWTKNPANMIDQLDRLRDYAYYFQFTLTAYGRDVEPHLPNKREELIGSFQALSKKIGKERVIWRYDPIFVSGRYTVDYHLKAFEEIADSLADDTQRVVVSFLDSYAKTERNMSALGVKKQTDEELFFLAEKLSDIARRHQLVIESCAESIELEDAGIRHGSCIDKELIEGLLGCSLRVGKDKSQRAACGCLESIDVGAYNTCPNGCRYCYANASDRSVKETIKLYDANAPLLCGRLGVDDKVTERSVRPLRDGQMKLSL